ncbi:Uncharacterised protein [Raoultella ornithinolytica]|nr:Uncharacterised protein [Raoultella ornithinolytica]
MVDFPSGVVVAGNRRIFASSPPSPFSILTSWSCSSTTSWLPFSTTLTPLLTTVFAGANRQHPLIAHQRFQAVIKLIFLAGLFGPDFQRIFMFGIYPTIGEINIHALPGFDVI